MLEAPSILVATGASGAGKTTLVKHLANADMDCWAAYLRAQADALHLPIIDTSDVSVPIAAAPLVEHVERLLRSNARTT